MSDFFFILMYGEINKWLIFVGFSWVTGHTVSTTITACLKHNIINLPWKETPKKVATFALFLHCPGNWC